MSNFQEPHAYLEQYQQNGGDMGEILRAYQALTSTGKTPLGLNQWVLTDKPRMEEFNEDNRIIDEQLRNKVNMTSPAVNFKLYAGNTVISKDIDRIIARQIGNMLFLKARITFTVGQVNGDVSIVGVPKSAQEQNTSGYIVSPSQLSGNLYISGNTLWVVDSSTNSRLQAAKLPKGENNTMIIDLSYVVS